MAGWCTTCIPEARALGRLHDEAGDRVDIVAVSIEPTETPESLAPFQEVVGNPGYAWVIDRGSRIASEFGVTYLDTTVILDAAGREVYRDEYSTSYRRLRQALSEVL